MIIFIIPYHSIGGAERVHAEIIKAISPLKRILIVFDYTDGGVISPDFSRHPHLVIGRSRIKRILFLGGISLLSMVMPLTIFGCNSFFFYRLLPLLSKRTVRIDLTHAFSYPDSGIEEYAKHYVSLISKRIVINHQTLENYRDQYKKEGIDLGYMERFQVIPNGVHIKEFDDTLIQKRFETFTIGYVGRFASEKRPELFLELSRKNCGVQFAAKMISDKFEGPASDYPDLKLVLGKNDPVEIREEFSAISVLMITSSREGFPIVIMEAMELGIPVISVNVGSISEHVIDGHNGYLFGNGDTESFLSFCCEKIELMGNDKNLYNKISLNARRYAAEHFNIEKMHKAYRKLFLDE